MLSLFGNLRVMNDINFKNKTVVITGASSGIGAGIAVAFAKLGANLVLTGRNLENLQSVKRQCVKEGLNEKQVVLTNGDIAKTECQQQLIDTAISTFKHLDVLVNNAGIGSFETAPDLTMELFDKIHNVNLRAPMALSILALPHLMKTKGNIVNVSSMAGLVPLCGILSYCISKAGLDMLTKGLALEMGAHGVRVNAVNPGFVKTNILNELGAEKANEVFESTAQLHALGRLGEIEEMANSVIFLASEKASFITGNLLGVHGGAALGIRFPTK